MYLEDGGRNFLRNSDTLINCIMAKITQRYADAGIEGRRKYTSKPFTLRPQKEVSGQQNLPATLRPGKTLYPLYRRLGRPRGRCERHGKSLPSRIRSPDLPAVSELLYRVRHPGSHGNVERRK